MEFAATETILVEIRFDPASDMHGELFRWQREHEIFPLKGTSGGSPNWHYGSYKIDEGRKLVEWLKTKGTQV